MNSLLLKKVLLGLSLSTALLLAGEQFSMSKADKAMYEELKENNPADMNIEEGMELFEELGDEVALAKFLEVDEKKLPDYIAGFPRYINKMENVVGLDQVLQAMQVAQGVKRDALSSEAMVNLLAYVKSLANDIAINIDVKENKEMEVAYALGEKLYLEERGYRGLSCNSCHSLPGTILRTQILPEMGAHNTGGTWPAYRMTLSSVVTLQERSRTCMRDAGQAPLPLGSKEMVALEVYITNLAKNNKHKVEIPGLKR
ncbi:MAG: sulfur oxidation protein SoxA [uncultured Sulfurovum sp.]|uniref:L-cysteine S-thiosulfotransferase subunit SoxA n=1 Tax=uncultured Sulfurovum sp. TaxID=269237 RepID=A0A6S6SAS1_9BACT|nr:MAG: sulfur oxidation protein SoxA [uncultured Sulfurovum sp.]